MPDDKRQPARFTRRKLFGYAGRAALTAVVGSALDGLAVEPKWIHVTHPQVRVRDLPMAWDGVRIAQLTDLHVGPLIALDYVRRAIALVKVAQPDITVFTGDLVTRADAASDELADLLAELPPKDERFAVLGNHDYWCDPRAVYATLSRAGFSLLINRATVLRRGGQGLCIAGVDDLWGGRPNAEEALAYVEPGTPCVMLCHNPDYADDLPAGGRVDLMLCGHTHGGQFKIPFGPRPVLPIDNPLYAAGLAQGPRCQVYTSVGLGMMGVPFRFNCRPELALITLRRA